MPVGLYAGANVSIGNGATLAFPYNFKILDQTHVEVKVDGALKVLGADYTVTGVGLSNGGNVNFLAAPANGAVVQRARKVPIKRDQDYQNNGDFKELTVDNDFDTIEMQVQQIAADVARAFKAPLSVTADQVFSDADWAARAGKFVRIKNDGSGPEFIGASPADNTFTATGVGAIARSWSSKVGEIKSITDYGADPANTAAQNRVAIQKALDANYGGRLLVPAGTFLVDTAGAVVAPVGDALSITGAIAIVFEGVIKSTVNCNAFKIAAGATDIVLFLPAGGGVQGMARNWLAAFATANKNGALVYCASGIPRIRGIRLIDPVQYAVFSDGVTDGEVSGCDFIGGWANYDLTAAIGPNDNSYYVCLNNGSTGWKVNGNSTLSAGTGRRMSQAIASITLAAGTADRLQSNANRLFNQHEKGYYVFGDDVEVVGNWVYDCPNGEGIRVIGKRPLIVANIVRTCVGGGISAMDAQGALVAKNQISNCNGSSITLKYYNAVIAGKSLSDAKIIDNSISGTTAGANRLAAIDVRGDATAVNIEKRITIRGNEINTANYENADERSGIDIQPGSAGTTFQELEVCDNRVNDCGFSGIRFRTGTYSYADCNRNRVISPGMVAARPAIQWDAAVTWVGQQIKGNQMRTGAGAMTYGMSNNAAANIKSTDISDNHSRDHSVAGYLNMQDVSNSRARNRMGDNPIADTFVMAAANNKVIANSNVQAAGGRVKLIPLNAAAAVLQSGANFLYHDVAADVAATSFTVKTAGGGAAAGTELFGYELDV